MSYIVKYLEVGDEITFFENVPKFLKVLEAEGFGTFCQYMQDHFLSKYVFFFLNAREVLVRASG